MNNISSDFYIDHHAFYSYFQGDAPRPSGRAVYRNFPEGFIYSHALGEYVAPSRDGMFFEEGYRIRNNRFHSEWSLGVNLDTIVGKNIQRLNISIDVDEIPEKGKGIKNTYINNPRVDIKTGTFARMIRILKIEENFDHVRVIANYSANGGQTSYAAELANKTGLPVTGYRGEVRTRTVEAIQRSANIFPERRYLSPLNYLRNNPGDNTWRPTALAKEFHPSFGSPGFDNMGKFFEGAFLR